MIPSPERVRDVRYLTAGNLPAGRNGRYRKFADLAHTSIPEPTTVTLALAALCLAMSRRRAF